MPCSTMRPPSSTTIRPAWRIVDSRWAMTIAVRPASSRRRPCLDRALGLDVDVRGRLVEHEDARVGDQCAGERDQLALAGRQLHAALADLGVVAVLELVDEVVGADGARRGGDLLVASPPGARTRCSRAIVPLNRNPSWGRSPLRAQRRAATSRRSWPSTQHAPIGGS